MATLSEEHAKRVSQFKGWRVLGVERGHAWVVAQTARAKAVLGGGHQVHLLVTKPGLQLTLRSYFPMLFTYSKRINREAHHCTLHTLNQGLLKLY